MNGIVYDVQSTTYAHGVAPDLTSSLAEIMAPQCVQPAANGQYIQFDDDEAFRYVETRRALGGEMAMIDFPSTSPRFNCSPHALGIGTDVFEKQRVGAAGLQMLREAKVRTLISRNALSREQRVYKAYEDGTTPEDGLGVWTDKDTDPIDELNTIVVEVARNTGNPKVQLVIALDVLQQINKHPKVIARFPGAALVNVTADVLGKMLILPPTVHIGMMPIAFEKQGRAANKQFIGTGKVYAFISQENPSPFDPSAAKTFTTAFGQVEGVGFVEKPPFAEVNYMAWSEDIKMTGSQCVKRINASLGPIE